MNIIYITKYRIFPNAGGIERITYSLANALTTLHGHTCYSIHALENVGTEDMSNVFKQSFHVDDEKSLRQALQQIGNGVIVLQTPCPLTKMVLSLKQELPNFKIVYVYHASPGYELAPMKWEAIKYRLFHHIDTKWTIKQLCVQILSLILPNRCMYAFLRKKYAVPYGRIDKIVLLSLKYIPQYQQIASGDEGYFTAIPNALSFPAQSVAELPEKQKEVLIVTRLEEWQKRIATALDIWQIVQKDTRYQDWKLRIVGYGQDNDFYQNYVKKHAIPNVYFEGLQSPLSYYKQASIFMMTSAFEGFPMTIMETEQCGCVPIVFDNFASAQDIICDGENGFLISNNDKELYAQRLQQLMRDKSLRESMSCQCVTMSKRFTIEKVAAQWNNLLESL